MPIYRRRPSTACQWSGQQLVPSRLAAESDSEAWFVLPQDGEGDHVWEALNGRLIGNELVEVRAVPALAYGIAFGDRVDVVRSAEDRACMRAGPSQQSARGSGGACVGDWARVGGRLRHQRIRVIASGEFPHRGDRCRKRESYMSRRLLICILT